MKKILLLALSVPLILNVYAQAGRYAGTKKSLVGMEFTNLDTLPQLKGWEWMEESFMSEYPMTSKELHIATLYKKGTTCVIIFSVQEDTASFKKVVADVVEVTGVLKGWHIRTWSCRQNKKPNSYIVALGRQTDMQYMKPVKKAWRFNPVKRRAEVIPVTGVDCEQESGD